MMRMSNICLFSTIKKCLEKPPANSLQKKYKWQDDWLFVGLTLVGCVVFNYVFFENL